MKIAANDLRTAIEIAEDIVIPEPEHGKSVRPKVFVTRFVVSQSLGHIVLSTIDFDDKPLRETHEIDDQVIDGSLASEVESVLLQEAQEAPEFSFRFGFVLAELTGTFIRNRQTLRSNHPTPPAFAPLRRATLPVKGRVTRGAASILSVTGRDVGTIRRDRSYLAKK